MTMTRDAADDLALFELEESPDRHENAILSEQARARDITIWNDLAAWYASPDRYDVALTHNCVHHFRNLSYVAACIRKKLQPGGLWLMVREWYADTPEEVYQLMHAHPYSQRYGLF